MTIIFLLGKNVIIKNIIYHIPEGFSYVEGESDNGYVIQDINGNQYVWVPCTNKDINDVIKLQRKDFLENSLIKYYDCNNLSYINFIESALENGGFYISRYEIGKENEKTVSKKQAIMWTNVSQEEAVKICIVIQIV